MKAKAYEPVALERCPVCRGIGFKPTQRKEGAYVPIEIVTCSYCHGMGFLKKGEK